MFTYAQPRKLAQTLDREPSTEDVAEMLDRPLESVKRMFGLNERATSVDAPAGRDAERPLLGYHRGRAQHRSVIAAPER